MYFVLNAFTFGKGIGIRINGISLRFPTRYFRYFPPDYEADNFTFLTQKCKSGDVVIDIGAHFGLFAIAAAKSVAPAGRVYAFEPTPSTFKVLSQTIGLNKFESVIRPSQKAVADKPGKTKFYIGETPGDVANSLVNYNDTIHKGYDVELTSCDSFCDENKIAPAFLKIDAEGAELSVLKGASKTLKIHRPFCILSMHPLSLQKGGNSNEMVWDFVQQFNYEILYENKRIDKAGFVEKKDLFDVHLLPRG